jgi:hypothetical protein
MRIKNFKYFNENVGLMSSYKDALSKYDKINREDLEDRLIEVTDLGVKLAQLEPKIVDENGTLFTGNPKDGEKFFLSYNITLVYTVESLFGKQFGKGKTYDVEKLTEKLKNLVEIQETVSKVAKNLAKIYNLNLSILKVSPIIGENNAEFEEFNRYSYYIKLISDEILTDDISKVSSEYESSYHGRANKAYEIIKKYMEDKGVENPSLDFNWDMINEFEGTEDDYLPMGFFTEDDIIVIAHWKPFTNTIEYDEDEVDRAVRSYEDGEMS